MFKILKQNTEKFKIMKGDYNNCLSPTKTSQCYRKSYMMATLVFPLSL